MDLQLWRIFWSTDTFVCFETAPEISGIVEEQMKEAAID